MAATEHATVIFREGASVQDGGLSRVQTAYDRTARQRLFLINWARSNGLEADLNAVGEPTALGAIEVRASPKLLRAIAKLPEVAMVVRE